LASSLSGRRIALEAVGCQNVEYEVNAVPILSNRRWWLIAVALAVGLAGAGEMLTVALRGNSQAGAAAPSAAPGYRKVVAFGHVDALDRVRKMYVTVPGGLVSEVLVKEGDSVPAGAVLVRLDDTQARRKVDEAKAALDQAKINLERGRKLPEEHQIRLRQAQALVDAAEYQRQLAKLGVETKQRLESTNTGGLDAVAAAQLELKGFEEALRIKKDDLRKLQLMDASTEVRLLEAQVKQAEALLGQAQAALTQFALVAPTAGTVLEITVAVGDTVGSVAPAPAVQFCPQGPRVVRAGIDQASASLVEVGQTVTIEDDTNVPGRWTGRVKWVSDVYTPQRAVVNPDANQYSDVRTMPCIIELDPDQPPLKINQRVLASIEVPVK
jgi:multidrug resistance efflux pump